MYDAGVTGAGFNGKGSQFMKKYRQGDSLAGISS